VPEVGEVEFFLHPAMKRVRAIATKIAPKTKKVLFLITTPLNDCYCLNLTKYFIGRFGEEFREKESYPPSLHGRGRL
jgi:hypothetical protein